MKIGIVHYRAGRTDGVSLEIEKRRKVLESLGHEVRIISGPVSSSSDYVINLLEFDFPEIIAIKENCFAWFNNLGMTATELMQRISNISLRIKDEFTRIHEQEKFDLLLVHNIFSHGRHIAAASAFAHFIRSHNVDVIATHHDFYWERREYAQPSFPEVEAYLNEYVPMRSPRVKHICINTIAQRKLEERGMKSEVIGDVFDFSRKSWGRDDFNSDLLKNINVNEDDLIVLQATRIVRRKGIELAMHLVARLDEWRHFLCDKPLYNGKKITWDSKIVLVLAGYAEKDALDYVAKLKKLAKKLNIELRFIGSVINQTRKTNPKRYSLWDSYAYADLVTFPSQSEGWGNQFIEAVFARCPVAVFEYPVFCSDVKSEGYEYISLGRKTIEPDEFGLEQIDENTLVNACAETVEFLTREDTQERLDHNFELGRKYHDLSVLREYYKKNLAKYTHPESNRSSELIPSEYINTGT